MTDAEVSALRDDSTWYRLQRDEERERLLRLARLVERASVLARMTAMDEIARLER